MMVAIADAGVRVMSNEIICRERHYHYVITSFMGYPKHKFLEAYTFSDLLVRNRIEIHLTA